MRTDSGQVYLLPIQISNTTLPWAQVYPGLRGKFHLLASLCPHERKQTENISRIEELIVIYKAYNKMWHIIRANSYIS